MDINLAYTAASACSLGALYNLGKSIASSSQTPLLEPNDIIIKEPVSEEVSLNLQEEISALEAEKTEFEVKQPSLEKTAMIISPQEFEDYISAIVTANSLKTNKLNSLLTAVGLAALSYLFLQNSNLNDQNAILTKDLQNCTETLNASPIKALQAISLDLFSFPEQSPFYGTSTNAAYNFLLNLPGDIENNCKKVSEHQKWCVQYIKGTNSQKFTLTNQPTSKDLECFEKTQITCEEKFSCESPLDCSVNVTSTLSHQSNKKPFYSNQTNTKFVNQISVEESLIATSTYGKGGTPIVKANITTIEKNTDGKIISKVSELFQSVGNIITNFFRTSNEQSTPSFTRILSKL